MAESNQLDHHFISNTALPYVTNDSPSSTDPMFQAGSNILTSMKGFFEKRNGFSTYCSAAFTFSAAIAQFFTWRRWTGAAVTLSGAYFEMYSVIDTSANTSKVYKRQVGTDTNPILIHTDSTTAQPFMFVVSNNFVFFGDGVDMKKYDGTTVTNWGITAPSSAVTVTTTTGSLSPVIGYQYVITFENSSTTHMSSPSTPSTTTGAQTSKNFIVTGNTTTDAQVDKVGVFRTIDGGSIYFEHPSSPVAYATWTASGLTDSSADTALTTNVAPLPNQNNRPTASLDPVWFANRIWTHLNDTIYYSDFEELVRGVEEESFASTNLRFFGREIFGKHVAGQYLLIFTADTIYRIYGDSLATFRMDKLSDDRGALNGACICSFTAELGGQAIGLVAWLDSSNTVWITDGSSMVEISKPIRPDIDTITHSQAALTYHSTGNAQWLVLMDGAAGVLRVYDVDMSRWMPPWPIEAIQAIYSGQTAPGTRALFLGRNKVPLKQDTGYSDQGSPYAASITTNLFNLVPENNPSAYGILDHVALESASVTATTVKYLTDEDPSVGTYTATQAAVDPPHRTQGTALVEKWYMTHGDPACRGARRLSVQVNFAAATTSISVYTMALGYQGVDT